MFSRSGGRAKGKTWTTAYIPQYGTTTMPGRQSNAEIYAAQMVTHSALRNANPFTILLQTSTMAVL